MSEVVKEFKKLDGEIFYTVLKSEKRSYSFSLRQNENKEKLLIISERVSQKEGEEKVVKTQRIRIYKERLKEFKEIIDNIYHKFLEEE